MDQEAMVIPFPANKQAGRIDHVVNVIMAKPSIDAAEAYWQKTILRNYAIRLESYGLDGETIKAEIATFRDAVCSELSKRGWFQVMRTEVKQPLPSRKTEMPGSANR